MIEAAITAARLCGAAALCVYFARIAGKMIVESLDELRRRREKREKERLEQEWRRMRPPPPPPQYQPDPQIEPPPQGCTAEERAEILAALEGLVHTYYISPCKICTNRAVDSTQYPCACCRDGQYFIAKWRRDGEIIPDPKHWYPK